MKITIFTAALFLTSAAFAQQLFGNDEHAFVLMPSEVIASGQVFDPSISSSSKVITYCRKFPKTLDSVFDKSTPGDAEWFAYNRISKRNTKLAVPPGTIHAQPLGDDITVYFQCNDQNRTQGFTNIDSARFTIMEGNPGPFTYTGEIASAPFYICEPERGTLYFSFPNGTSSTVHVPPQLKVYSLIDASPTELIFLCTKPSTGRKRSQGKAVFNRSTLEFVYHDFAPNELDTLMTRFDGPDQFVTTNDDFLAYISLYDSSKEISTPVEGEAAAIPRRQKPVPKAKPKSNLIPLKALIGPSDGSVRVSNLGEIVIYQDAGSLLLREIKAVDAVQANKLAMQVVRSKLVHQVKQVGLGFIMYASDCDDVFPTTEGWETKLKPYMKDDQLMNGFTYSFAGGNAASVADPANTELGFVVGPGGRAVVYVDGHAKWVPNP